MKRIPVCTGCKKPRAECSDCGKGFLEVTQQGEVPEFILVEANDPKYPNKSPTSKPANDGKADDDKKVEEEAKDKDSKPNSGQRNTGANQKQLSILNY